ncbi:MAG: isoprenylcysteine carboxylmethyltransferase family protein [Candidatus Sulfomarinibacteraceae bacterium]
MARILILAAQIIGGGSLMAFGVFLYRGPFEWVALARTDAEAVIVDTLVSVAFFIQHSGMVRRSVRERLSLLMPAYAHGAMYSIASGLTLLGVVVLWQPTELVVFQVDGPVRWLLRVCFIAAVLSFGWAIRALGSFDGFGVGPVKAHLRGRPVRELPLTIRGPYRWVRHPLYTMVLVMIWSSPDLTGDRLLFNLAWTLWIVIGSTLEERDLVEAFGDDYIRYQQAVPMLLPWRLPRR